MPVVGTVEAPGQNMHIIVHTGRTVWPVDGSVTLLRREVVVQTPWLFVPSVATDRVVATGRVVGSVGKHHARVRLEGDALPHAATHAVLALAVQEAAPVSTSTPDQVSADTGATTPPVHRVPRFPTRMHVVFFAPSGSWDYYEGRQADEPSTPAAPLSEPASSAPATTWPGSGGARRHR